MKRREFIAALSGAVAWPAVARAQQSGKLPVIGYLSARSAATDVQMLVFKQGLSASGYVEGQNVAIEYRWGDGQYDRLPALADELVRRQVTVVVTSGGEVSALAAKAATTTTPIVFVAGGDPVKTGLVISLHQPGGNLTGVTTFVQSLGTKQLGLLRELIPTPGAIAFLTNPNEPATKYLTKDVEGAARVAKERLIVLPATTEHEIDAAFTTLVQQGAVALLVGAGALFFTRKHQLIELTSRHAMPALYFRREFADEGGLMSYGSSILESYRQLGIYTGRILGGTKPADLPVVQPTKFEFVLNLRTAKALGISIPPQLLARADEVIE